MIHGNKINDNIIHDSMVHDIMIHESMIHGIMIHDSMIHGLLLNTIKNMRGASMTAGVKSLIMPFIIN